MTTSSRSLAAVCMVVLGCASSGSDQTSSAAESGAIGADESASGAPGSLSERAKIDRLLAAVRSSGIIFIRNGSEHDAAEAAEHLSTKLGHAGGEIKTARDFIDKLGTRSSMSGDPYQVRLPDGKTMPAGEWLNQRLREIEAAR